MDDIGKENQTTFEELIEGIGKDMQRLEDENEILRQQLAKQPIEGPDPLLDAKEVKRILKCSLPLVYKLADRGQIPCVRWECPSKGNKKSRSMVRFKRKDIVDFIESHCEK